MIFEGIAGTSYQADIALDDVSVGDGACPPSKLCDFEVDRCEYTNAAGFNMQWYRDRGGTSSIGTGPSKDHTTNSAKGMCATACMSFFRC